MSVEVNKMLLRIKYPTFPVEYLDDMYQVERIGGVIAAEYSPWYASYYIFQFTYNSQKYKIERNCDFLKLITMSRNMILFRSIEELIGVLCQLRQ